MALRSLVSEVLAHSTSKRSVVHGTGHWRRVALIGAALGEEVRDVDGLVVFLFALFHDAMRFSDGVDPGHGRRGGDLADELISDELLLDERIHLLFRACDSHMTARQTAEPTIACCLDADRLDLWRLGVRPNVALLSTPAARRRIEWARTLQGARLPSWDELVEGVSGQ